MNSKLVGLKNESLIKRYLKEADNSLKCWQNSRIDDSIESLRKSESVSRNFLRYCNNAQKEIEKNSSNIDLNKNEQIRLMIFLNKLWELYKNAPLTINSVDNRYADKGWMFGFIEDRRNEFLGITSKMQSPYAQKKLNIEDDITKTLDTERIIKIILDDEKGRNMINCNEKSSLQELVKAISVSESGEKGVLESISELTVDELYEILRNGPAGNYYYIQTVTNYGFGYGGKKVEPLELKISFLKEYFKDLQQFFLMRDKQEKNRWPNTRFLEGFVEATVENPNGLNVSTIRGCVTKVGPDNDIVNGRISKGDS